MGQVTVKAYAFLFYTLLSDYRIHVSRRAKAELPSLDVLQGDGLLHTMLSLTRTSPSEYLGMDSVHHHDPGTW
jgi:hypothetical protein